MKDRGRIILFTGDGKGKTTAALGMVLRASGHGMKLISTRFGFHPERVFNHIHERGNCIAASIPLALTEAVQTGRIRRSDRVLLIGTGAGLSVGALALTF